MWDNENLVKTLQGNGVVVMPTDTLYGIVGKAENKETVERIYELRKRSPDKPCIILIGNINDLGKFGVVLTSGQEEKIKKIKEPTSFVLDCEGEKFEYLHRGTKTLAFRIPAPKELQNLLKQTGPLVAPSANMEAMPPSTNITEARKYFGEEVDLVRNRPPEHESATVTSGRPVSNGVDLYIDGGEIVGKASRVIKLQKDSSVSILRE